MGMYWRQRAAYEDTREAGRSCETRAGRREFETCARAGRWQLSATLSVSHTRLVSFPHRSAPNFSVLGLHELHHETKKNTTRALDARSYREQRWRPIMAPRVTIFDSSPPRRAARSRAARPPSERNASGYHTPSRRSSPMHWARSLIRCHQANPQTSHLRMEKSLLPARHGLPKV